MVPNIDPPSPNIDPLVIFESTVYNYQHMVKLIAYFCFAQTHTKGLHIKLLYDCIYVV